LLLLVLQCVVAAELVAIAGDTGIKCGGAMLRDVGVYGVAVSSVLLAFALGKVSLGACLWRARAHLLRRSCCSGHRVLPCLSLLTTHDACCART
jgi:hypothetical protein